MKGDDIAVRLVALAASVVKIVDALPDTLAGRHVAGQLLRSGTSPGANYEEAPADPMTSFPFPVSCFRFSILCFEAPSDPAADWPG